MAKLIAVLLLALALVSAVSAERSLKQNVAASAQAIAIATAGAQPKSPPSVCSNAKSKNAPEIKGVTFKAILNGSNNVKPNSTMPMPLATPANGMYELVLDEKNQKARWTLKLCDINQYIAAHLHSGSPKSDYPPPLIPLEPYVKPANPFGPPNLLPQLCPPVNIKGCSYTAQGSFNKGDIIPLPGRPQDKGETPAVLNFADFVKVLKSGKIYINIHSKVYPAGLIRGNLQQQR